MMKPFDVDRIRFRPIDSRAHLSLDGAWRVTAPSDSPFKVPGQFVQQGLGLQPEDQATVEVEFEIPDAWKGKNIFLRFDAVYGKAVYRVNDTVVAESERMFTPVEVEVTAAVWPGRNRLSVDLCSDCTAERLAHMNAYSQHNLCGIHRSVHLFALPETHIEKLHVNTRLDSDYRDAVLQIDCVATGAAQLEVDLAEAGVTEHALDEGSNRIEIPVPNPRKWNAEKPELYPLKLTVLRDGISQQVIEQQVGFRSVDVKGSEILINGVPVQLAGINRHEIDPQQGRADSAKWAEKDAALFKEANINYVRTSHYPPTHEFMEACDRAGLYVEVEAPFCWTRKQTPTGENIDWFEEDEKYRPFFEEATAAMIEYHRNHPSCIIWSLANECGYTEPQDEQFGLPQNYVHTLNLTRSLDVTRPVLFNNEWAKDGGLGDIATIHYPPAEFENYRFIKEDPRPILQDEFHHIQCYNMEELRMDPGCREEWSLGHVTFGRTDGLRHTDPTSWWNRMFYSPSFAGGAIWSGIDDQFPLPDGSVAGYGTWGCICDIWRRPKPEQHLTKGLYAPVWIPVQQLEYTLGQERVRIEIENRYSFTNLAELSCEWKMNEGCGMVELPSIEPRQKGVLDVPVPVEIPDGTRLNLHFKLGGKPVVVWPLRIGKAQPRKYSTRMSRDLFEAAALQLDQKNGLFNHFILTCFPTPHITQKERKNWFQPDEPPYLELPKIGTRQIRNVTVSPNELRVEDSFADFDGQTVWRIDAEGNSVFEIDYRYTGPDMDVRETGIRFRLPKDFQTLSWQRKSQWTAYPEDHIGRDSGTAVAVSNSMGQAVSRVKPEHSWNLDSNELGTADFRSSKFNITEAELRDGQGRALRVEADMDRHVRCCLVNDEVFVHVLTANPAPLTDGSRIRAVFYVALDGPY
jgi:hypothetical protein